MLLGVVLSSAAAVAGLVMANVIASRDDTASASVIMYTVAIAFGWDFLVVQVVYGLVQTAGIKHLRGNYQTVEELKGVVSLVVSYDIAVGI